MSGAAPPPVRVLELRSTAGQGGGPERVILVAAAAAATLGVEETLCFLRRRGQGELATHRRARALGAASHMVLERAALDLRTLGSLRQLVRERGIELVHAHDYKADFYAALLARLEGVVPVATAHGWPERTWRERRLYYPVDRRLLASFPLVFAVSDDLRERLLGAGADPRAVETLPNAVDLEMFRPDPEARARVRREWGIGDRATVVGSLGRLEAEKRPDLLLQAFAEATVRRPEARLVVAGTGPAAARLAVEAGRLGLDGRWLALGHREDAEDVLRGFDVYVQASDSEGSPLGLLEAMASGTAVIATAVGDTAALVRDRAEGLLVPPGDAAALARALEETLGDPVATRRRAAAGRRRVAAERSLRERLAHVAGRYREVLAARRGHRS